MHPSVRDADAGDSVLAAEGANRRHHRVDPRAPRVPGPVQRRHVSAVGSAGQRRQGERIGAL